MDAHLKNTFAHGFAVTEIAMFGRSDTKNDAGTAHFVFQVSEPVVELFGAFKGVHEPRVYPFRYKYTILSVTLGFQMPNQFYAAKTQSNLSAQTHRAPLVRH